MHDGLAVVGHAEAQGAAVARAEPRVPIRRPSLRWRRRLSVLVHPDQNACADVDERIGDLAVTLTQVALVDGLAVPLQPQPLDRREDVLGQFRLVALRIGVLDAQQELALLALAKSQLNRTVRAPPTCR